MKNIESYSSQQLEVLMKNAKTQQNADVYHLAFRQWCSLQGVGHDEKLVADFYRMLAAYERVAQERRGDKRLASRTRQKLKNKGVVQCLIDWASSDKEEVGFVSLMERGMRDLTAEQLVIDHADRFDATVVEAAHRKISNWRLGADC